MMERSARGEMFKRIYALDLAVLLCALAAPSAGRAASKEWILADSTLSYHVSHPLHQIDGVTHQARGKGTCESGICNFLIAAPLKTFDSRDSNRDLHMLQVTRAGEFPLVMVRTSIPENAIAGSSIDADLEIRLAGQTAHYKVPLQLMHSGVNVKLSGTIPATIADFKIPAPSLLSLPIKNEIPVRVEMTWHPE